MRQLAELVMRGRSPAVAVIAVAALLSLLLPPLSYVSGAAVALVTLRAGPAQGLTVMLAAALAVALLSLLVFGNPWAGAAFLALLWVPSWVLAGSLRRTARLQRALLLAGAFGVALVLGFYAAVGDPAAWWREALATVLAQAGGEGQGDEGQVAAALEPALGLMTGAATAALVTSLLGSLCLARWWQAMLYNPGGFRREFHGLRLGRGPTVAALVLVGFALLGGAAGRLAAELLVVVGVLFVVQGLALVHGLVGRTGAGRGWLVGTYALLLLALPQMAITLALAGVADSWFDFRSQFGGKTDN